MHNTWANKKLNHGCNRGMSIASGPVGDKRPQSWPRDERQVERQSLLPIHLVGSGGISVHLVDSDDELLDSQQVDQAGVLAGLALHLSGLVVALLDGGGEVTVGGDHQQAHVGLGGAGNHVLDEIPVTCGAEGEKVDRSQREGVQWMKKYERRRQRQDPIMHCLMS